MLQVIKSRIGKIQRQLARVKLDWRIESMIIEYNATGFYQDLNGVTHYDSRGIQQAVEQTRAN
jgi:hypothetical protein